MTPSLLFLSRIANDLEALLQKLDDLHAEASPDVQRVLTEALCHLQMSLDTVRNG